MLEVRFDRISYGINEKKTLTPTLKMVEMALSNVGFRDGVWLLKSPHRTRKKGAERFRAVRFDGSGIRIRCKPGGNETCYEWTLFAPSGTDMELLFADLCGLHPSDLRVIRSSSGLASEKAILGGVIEHLADRPPGLLPEGIGARDIAEDLAPKAPECLQEDLSGEGASDNEENTNGPSLSLPEISVMVADVLSPSIPSISSLDISGMEGRLNSDQVLDRALIAFGTVLSGRDWVSKAESSRAMIRHLNVSGLAGKSDIYGSVKGAMKSLMANLRSKGYLERIVSSENTTRGYKITEKGKKRLGMVVQMLDSGAAGRLGLPSKKEESQLGSSERNDKIGAIKNLLGEHEMVVKEISDLKELMADLGREGEDEKILLSGLTKAMEEKVEQRKSVDAEISRLRTKIEEKESKAAKISGDMLELESELDRMERRRSELEGKIFSDVR